MGGGAIKKSNKKLDFSFVLQYQTNLLSTLV